MFVVIIAAFNRGSDPRFMVRFRFISEGPYILAITLWLEIGVIKVISDEGLCFPTYL